MGWQNQGRQRHGWFGHGTGPAKPKPHKPDTPVGTFRRNVADLARVIYNEASGNGSLAMTAVGWTLRNRMLRNDVGRVDAAWAGYNHGAPQIDNVLDRGAYATSQQVATGILDGKIADPTGGATHYYSPQLMADLGKKGDVSGGLESVSGVIDRKTRKPTMNYCPGYSRVFPQMKVPGIADKDFKFYRQPEGTGRVH